MSKVLTLREKTFIYITLSIVVGSLIYNFFLASFFNELDSVNRDISLTRTKIRKYNLLLAQKTYIEGQYNDLIHQLNSSGAPQKDMLVNAFTGLETLAKDANVHIVDVRPQNQSIKSTREVSIELKSEGSMEGLLKYIYDIENSLFLLQIKKFQITVKNNASNLEGLFTIAVQIGL